MEEASPIPIETTAPKHRGSAYTDFEKKISGMCVDDYRFYREDYIRCCSINFYPESVPQDEE